jgi:hypothetical protein
MQAGTPRFCAGAVGGTQLSCVFSADGGAEICVKPLQIKGFFSIMVFR